MLERNYRTRRAEIDIIAARDDVLAIVEVKLAVDGSATLALEKIDAVKRSRISLAARAYIAREGCPSQVRFDVAIVRGTPPDLRMDEYMEDAFRPQN